MGTLSYLGAVVAGSKKDAEMKRDLATSTNTSANGCHAFATDSSMFSSIKGRPKQNARTHTRNGNVQSWHSADARMCNSQYGLASHLKFVE